MKRARGTTGRASRRSRRVRLAGIGLLASVLVLGPLAQSAWAVLYRVAITQPTTSGVSGSVPVHASAKGFATTPTNAAYQVRPPGSGWLESAKVAMRRVGSGEFEASFASGGYLNGTYTLYVRAWGGEVLPYDPNDPATYAGSSKTLHISNAPSVPGGVSAIGGQDAASVTWSASSDTSRADFAGYRVYRTVAAGGACPAFDGSYELRHTTDATAYHEEGLPAGTYCYRVTATRTSPTSGTVASGASDAATALVSGALGDGGDPSPSPSPGDGGSGGDGGGGPGGGGDGDGSGSGAGGPGGTGGAPGYADFGTAPGAVAPDAPEPPALPKTAHARPAAPVAVDNGYDQDLPYGTRNGTDEVLSAPGALESAREDGVPPRNGALALIGAGVALILSSLLLWRFARRGAASAAAVPRPAPTPQGEPT